MPMTDAQHLELFKSLLTLSVSVATLALGWLVGQRLTMRWNVRQKQREFDLATAQEFHRLYGEFFRIWKLWNYSLSPNRGCAGSRSDLLERACAAEGAVESLFARLAASRSLRPVDIQAVGRFRQAYQRLRQSIAHGSKLDWAYSDHPEYLAFKQLAMEVAMLIVSESPPSQAEVEEHANALVSITSNRWETDWIGESKNA